MIKYITIQCSICKVEFKREAKYVNYSLKKNPNVQFYCTRSCKKYTQWVNCFLCGKEIERRRADLKKTKNSFCSNKCSAIYGNKNGLTGDKKKLVEKICSCGIKQLKPITANNLCSTCFPPKSKPKSGKRRISGRIKREYYESQFKTQPCLKCGKDTFIHCDAKYCLSCRKERASEHGRMIAANKVKRSKNEIYFAELCKQKFSNITENEQFFDGWDADVILHDYKIAILWNGIWHYQKVNKKHSVEQVQSRDKIKLKKINQFNYIPYVIKDMGKHNKEFVEEKFNEFLLYLNTFK